MGPKYCTLSVSSVRKNEIYLKILYKCDERMKIKGSFYHLLKPEDWHSATGCCHCDKLWCQKFGIFMSKLLFKNYFRDMNGLYQHCTLSSDFARKWKSLVFEYATLIFNLESKGCFFQFSISTFNLECHTKFQPGKYRVFLRSCNSNYLTRAQDTSLNMQF